MNSAGIKDRSEQTEPVDAFSEEVSLLYLLIILSRRRKFILGSTLTVTILAIIVSLLLPFQYTAITVVLPPGQNLSASSSFLGQIGGAGALASVAGASLGIKNPSDLYVSLLRSRSLEDAMIQRFGLMSRYHAKKQSGARVALEGHTKVVVGPKDGLITIAVTDRDPKEAADLGNGYVEEFRNLSANLAITEASQRRVFFEQQLLQSKEDLAAAEEAMKNTEQSTGILQVDSQTRSLIEAAAALRAQIAASEVQIQTMRTYATENNSELVMNEQQLIALKDQLAKLAGTDPSAGAGFLLPKGKVPAASIEYLRRLRDMKYYETISELISKQYEMAKLDEARQGTALQVVDRALPPDSRSSPKRTIIVAAAMLLTFLGTCLWSLFAERLRGRKDSPQNRAYLKMLRATFR
jgi:tyrosine-protein kinase Etk/Wzc